MKNYRIEHDFRLGFAVEFILENERPEDKLSNNFRCKYDACFDGDDLIGIVGYVDTKKTRRIRMVIVSDKYRRSDVYQFMILGAIDMDNRMEVTVFAPENIEKYFEMCGFKIVNINRNNIFFMRKEDKDEKSGL